ncbi:MAG TPA: hypothetical protein VER33_09045 [Polyangiaceae bacterium]|nr:hypothetical protein [Polyangiaceae bacterium]
MKKLKLKATSVGLTLLLGASVASAQTATPQVPTQLVGSDTLNLVMDTVFAGMLASGSLSGVGYRTYNGLGSTSGERQLEGNPTGTEPTCLPTDNDDATDLNPGCQEISPMSRPLDSSICNDTEAASEAEGLAICRDGLAVITDNAGAQQFAASAASCTTGTTDNSAGFPDRGYGNLRDSGSLPSGYAIGGGTLGAGNAWKDVLRLVYTGCNNTDGNCAAADRVARCGSAVRQELLNSWGNLFDGVNCGTNACTQLRQAYRRDDNSGTTQVFLELISVTRPLTSARTRLFLGPALVAIPANYAFCDGGQLEGFSPDLTGTGGDPIRRPCAPEDDLCRADGTAGVVRAIRTPVVAPVIDNAETFPAVQCTRGRFANVPYLNTALPVCPDGTAPRGGLCKLPFFASGTTRNFNCLNDLNSRPATAPAGTDGRSYNFVVRSSAGAVRYVTTANTQPQVAQWRQNMATMDTVIPVPGGPLPSIVCNQTDATRLVGCIVANTRCTLGFAGREAAAIDPYDNLNEPLRISGLGVSDADINSGYPLARDLFLNAIGGFENLTAQCNARLAPGTPPQVCADQVAIAQEFYNMTPLATNACIAAGYIPLAASRCVGTTGSAGCGAPTVQAKTACQPL